MIATRYWLPVLVLGSFIACNAVPEGEDDDGDGGSDSDDDDDDEDGPPKTTTGGSFKNSSSVGENSVTTESGQAPTTASNRNCDTGSCDSCVSCASESVCAQQTQACNSEPQCAPVYECVQACQDDACLQNCQAQYPQGYDALFNLLSCLYCQGCYQTCDGASVCG